MSKLLNRSNEILRQRYLERAKRQSWTGWEDAGPEQVEHLQIEDRAIWAVMEAVEERLGKIETSIDRLWLQMRLRT